MWEWKIERSASQKFETLTFSAQFDIEAGVHEIGVTLLHEMSALFFLLKQSLIHGGNVNEVYIHFM